MDLANLRFSYEQSGLLESNVPADPLDHFRRWFDDAAKAGVREPNAMTLATASADGKPNARTVLLKGVVAPGFVFYTNYESRKGRELQANPFAALLFYWPELERQVRISGEVQQVSEEESDRYFQSRPLGHQLGAWASQQSEIVSGREILEENLLNAGKRFESGPIPRPSYWGGYVVRPNTIEFWQGRPNRLHDRLEYVRSGASWALRRLSP